MGLDGAVKITDFGYGAQLGGGFATERESVVGTTYWMAPEVVTGRKYKVSRRPPSYRSGEANTPCRFDP